MTPDDGYICLIVNPKSGSSSSKLLVRQFNEYLQSKGYKIRTTITRSLEHVCELATKAAVDYDCSMVVTAGGDGTVREAAHGLEGSDKPLMVIPAGTENLLANELGFDDRSRTLVKAFESGNMRSLDLGSVNGKCFTSITGFGFDGAVVEKVTAKRSGHIRHLDYFWPIWRVFWNYEFPAIKVSADGEEIFDGPGLVFVGNISRYSLGLQILRKADYSDGLLDVCIFKCATQTHLLMHAMMTIFKAHPKRKDVIYRQAKTVNISSDDPTVRMEIDGDPGPELPVTIKVIPQAVRVIVPPNAKPAGMRTRLIRMFG